MSETMIQIRPRSLPQIGWSDYATASTPEDVERLTRLLEADGNEVRTYECCEFAAEIDGPNEGCGEYGHPETMRCTAEATTVLDLEEHVYSDERERVAFCRFHADLLLREAEDSLVFSAREVVLAGGSDDDGWAVAFPRDEAADEQTPEWRLHRWAATLLRAEDGVARAAATDTGGGNIAVEVTMTSGRRYLVSHTRRMTGGTVAEAWSADCDPNEDDAWTDAPTALAAFRAERAADEAFLGGPLSRRSVPVASGGSDDDPPALPVGTRVVVRWDSGYEDGVIAGVSAPAARGEEHVYTVRHDDDTEIGGVPRHRLAVVPSGGCEDDDLRIVSEERGTMPDGSPVLILVCEEWVGGRWEPFVSLAPVVSGGSDDDLLPPEGWHEQADGSLVCPHRDTSVCPSCAEAHEACVEVYSVWFWVPDSEERATLLAYLAATAAQTAAPDLPEGSIETDEPLTLFLTVRVRVPAGFDLERVIEENDDEERPLTDQIALHVGAALDGLSDPEGRAATLDCVLLSDALPTGPLEADEQARRLGDVVAAGLALAPPEETTR